MDNTPLRTFAPELYSIHEAIRKDLNRFADLSGRWVEMTDKEFTAISKYFDFHHNKLDIHHRAEDTFFFPRFLKRADKLGRDIDICEDEHAHLVALLMELSQAFAQKDLDALERLFQSYKELVERHLEDEEKMFVALIDDVYTHKQFERLCIKYAFVQGIKHGPIKSTEMLAWMLDAVDQEVKMSIFKRVPPFVPPVYRGLFKKRYEKRTAVFG